MTETVNHPGHYKTGNYECIEVMKEVFGEEAVKDFCKMNAFKYIWRSDRKNGDEDLKKAKWYLDTYLLSETLNDTEPSEPEEECLDFEKILRKAFVQLVDIMDETSDPESETGKRYARFKEIKGSRANYILFNHYLEALVAYHRYYGGKD